MIQLAEEKKMIQIIYWFICSYSRYIFKLYIHFILIDLLDKKIM